MEQDECCIGTFIRVIGSFAIMILLIEFLGAHIVFTAFGALLLWAYYKLYFT